MPVPMELSRIIISEINENQVIYLKEVDGERQFPILIGLFEATSIHRRVKGESSPRPLTHDLLVSIVEQLGGEFQDVVISELKEHTYFAKLRVRHDGELVEIDAPTFRCHRHRRDLPADVADLRQRGGPQRRPGRIAAQTRMSAPWDSCFCSP